MLRTQVEFKLHEQSFALAACAMTHPKVLTALAGVGIGLAVLFSFVALVLAGATLRKLNNDGAATSNGAAATTTAKLVVAASSKAWSYGEGPAGCGSCLISTLFAGQKYPAGTVRSPPISANELISP